MFYGSKKYSKSGRLRFGSTIFIDDLNEDLIDNISCYTRNRNMMLFGIVFMLFKIITGNGIGFAFGTLSFFSLYFFAKRSYSVSITKYRLLIIKEYSYPRLIRTISYIFLGTSIYCFIRIFHTSEIFTTNVNPALILLTMDWFQVLPVIQLQYEQYINQNFESLSLFDSLLSGLIYLIFSLHLFFMKYEFEEIHLSQIYEENIKLRRENSFYRILIFSFSLFFATMIIYDQFNLLFTMFMFIVYKYIPRPTVGEFNINGSSGGNILKKMQLPFLEFSRFSNLTAGIFGWKPVLEEKTKEFPQNLIPNDQASYYETGLRASILDSFKQANYLGLVISTVTNVLVLISLTTFALNNNPGTFPLVLGIGVGLIIVSSSIFQILNLFATFQYNVQQEESLMIGNSFVGRYIEPKLWIMRGEMLRGSRYQITKKNKIVSYNSVEGLIIQWRRISLYLLFFMFLLIIITWSSIGGLNINNAIYILPFLADLSFAFISEKASRELGFFIVFGYVFWIVLFFNYHRIYGAFRPQISLDLSDQVSIPILLKSYEDQQNASLQLSKCLLNTSRSTRRQTVGRPGSYILSVTVLSSNFSNPDKILEIGDQKLRFLISKITPNQVLIENLVVSGELGSPILAVSIIDQNNSENTITQQFEIDKNTDNQINVGSDLQLRVQILEELS